MKKKLSDAYWLFICIWYMLGFMLNFAIVLYVLRHGELAVLVLLALWWAVTLIGRKIRHTVEKKQKAKEQAEKQSYREKYIQEIPVVDERFGRVVFEYDSNLNTIGTDEYPLEKPFGIHKSVLYSELKGNDPSPAAAALRFVYDNSEAILQEMHEYTLECCELYEECDKDGKPYDMAYIRENLNIYSVHIIDYGENMFVSFSGDIYGDDRNDLLGGHAVTAHLKLNTSADISALPEISCGLEG